VQDKSCTFPLTEGYRPLTAAICTAALNALSTEDLAHFNVLRLKPADYNTVAAMLPNIDDLNDSATTDGDLSTHNVSSESHSTPHLVWDFYLDGPLCDLPVHVRGLIDDGSHLVLIDSVIVDKLGLRRFTLHKPEIVSLALNESSTPSNASLTEYIKLHAYSHDQSWTAVTVRALIAPSLCAPVILGLPWLERNHIVIDHHERTVIDKRTNYNLLDPAPPTPPKAPPMKLRDRLKKTKADVT
jgi:hypothetical protein